MSNFNSVTTEKFLALNGLFLIFFGILFLWGRRGSRPPSQLRVSVPETLIKNHQLVESVESKERAEELNSQFMYNGHTWDAYEVLGVSPNTSIEKVKEAFEMAILKTNPASHDFLKTALVTILNEMKRKGFKPGAS